MAFKTRKTPDAMMFALIAAHNQRIAEDISTFFHLDKTSTSNSADYTAPTTVALTVTAAASTDLATSVALVNNAKTVLNLHFADTVAHDSAVSAQVATATATDLATGITLANALKAAFNTHRSAASVHFTNDGANAIAATDASDQASLNTLLTEIKADFNLHFASAPSIAFIDLVSA